MPFRDKYQIVESLPGEGAQSYRARAIRGGREVCAHLLAGGKAADETKALMARLAKLPAAGMAKLLEIGEENGRSYIIITAPPFLALYDWLRLEEPGGRTTGVTGVTPPAPAPPPPAPARVSGGSEDADFSRMVLGTPPPAPAASDSG